MDSLDKNTIFAESVTIRFQFDSIQGPAIDMRRYIYHISKTKLVKYHLTILLLSSSGHLNSKQIILFNKKDKYTVVIKIKRPIINDAYHFASIILDRGSLNRYIYPDR